SYGLPSVNIRYTYGEADKQKQPGQQAAARAKQTSGQVKLETKKFNFPEPNVNSGGNSADVQLEHFLRDKFINGDGSKPGKPAVRGQATAFRGPSPQPSTLRPKS